MLELIEHQANLLNFSRLSLIEELIWYIIYQNVPD